MKDMEDMEIEAGQMNDWLSLHALHVLHGKNIHLLRFMVVALE